MIAPIFKIDMQEGPSRGYALRNYLRQCQFWRERFPRRYTLGFPWKLPEGVFFFIVSRFALFLPGQKLETIKKTEAGNYKKT